MKLLVPCIVAPLLIGLSGSFSPVPVHAAAKTYTWEKIDPAYSKRTTVTNQRVLKQDILMGKASLSSQQAVFDNWYRKYVFPAIASKNQLGELHQLRDSISKDLGMCQDANVHQYLVNLVYDEASRRVQGNYDPKVRYVALLIIGDLNSTEERLVGGDRFPPVCLPRALDLLVQEFNKPNQPDAVRVAAMIGIRRHAMLDGELPGSQPIPDAKKAEIAASMRTLAQQNSPPDGRSAAGHVWMRRLAVNILAEIGAVGNNQEDFNLVVGIMNNVDAPLKLRYTAASALAKFNYQNVTGIDALSVSQKLAAMVAFALRSEDIRIKDVLKKKAALPRTSGYGPGMPGMGSGSSLGEMGSSGGLEDSEYGGGEMMSGMGAPTTTKADDPDLEAARRRLKLPLDCALLGLRGIPERGIRVGGATAPTLHAMLAVAQDPQQKEAVQKILDAVNAIVEATDLDENGLKEMMDAVRAKASDLESLVPKSMLAVPSGDEAEAKNEETAADALPGASSPAAGGEPTKPATSGKKGPTKPGKKGPTKPGKKGPAKPGKKGPAKPGKKGN